MIPYYQNKNKKEIIMLKDATYKEKFAMLKDWMPLLIDSIKKDLKTEHLKQDPRFAKKYFSGKNLNKLTNEDLVTGYINAIDEEIDQLGEFIANRWILKNAEIYNYFEEQLIKINPNFQELDILDKTKSLDLADGSSHKFGAANTYLFAVLNSVVFPKEVYAHLNEKAKLQTIQNAKEEKAMLEKLSLQDMVKEHEREIARLTDKYEKKLAGMQKKYHIDTESLKKQLTNLQRKLSQGSHGQ